MQNSWMQDSADIEISISGARHLAANRTPAGQGTHCQFWHAEDHLQDWWFHIR